LKKLEKEKKFLTFRLDRTSYKKLSKYFTVVAVVAVVVVVLLLVVLMLIMFHLILVFLLLLFLVAKMLM